MKRTTSWNAGFTLLEMLVVMAIIGIIVAVGLPSFRTWQLRTVIENAAQQFARDIDNQRIEAKRLNTSQVIRVVNLSSYKVGTVTKTMPPGTTVVLNNTATMPNPLRFDPPYGTTVSNPPSSILPRYTIGSTADSSIFRTVSVVSLLGKVIVK